MKNWTGFRVVALEFSRGHRTLGSQHRWTLLLPLPSLMPVVYERRVNMVGKVVGCAGRRRDVKSLGMQEFGARSAINCLGRLIVERVEGASRVRDAAR